MFIRSIYETKYENIPINVCKIDWPKKSLFLGLTPSIDFGCTFWTYDSLSERDFEFDRLLKEI